MFSRIQTCKSKTVDKPHINCSLVSDKYRPTLQDDVYEHARYTGVCSKNK